MAKVQLTNGISWGAKYIVTNDDVSANKSVLEFVGNSGNVPFYDMAFVVMILRNDGVVTSDAKITIDGSTITIENGTTYNLTADDVVYVIGNRAM